MVPEIFSNTLLQFVLIMLTPLMASTISRICGYTKRKHLSKRFPSFFEGLDPQRWLKTVVIQTLTVGTALAACCFTIGPWTIFVALAFVGGSLLWVHLALPLIYATYLIPEKAIEIERAESKRKVWNNLLQHVDQARIDDARDNILRNVADGNDEDVVELNDLRQEATDKLKKLREELDRMTMNIEIIKSMTNLSYVNSGSFLILALLSVYMTGGLG